MTDPARQLTDDPPRRATLTLLPGGWLPDPESPSPRLRWHDGTDWSERTAELPDRVREQHA